LFWWRIAGRTDQQATERDRDSARPCNAEIGNLEDFLIPEPAAEDIARREISMNDTDVVNGNQATRDALKRVSRTPGVEREAGVLDRMFESLGERRSLDPTMNVLESEPRQLALAAIADRGDLTDVDQADDKRAIWDPFIEPTERNRFFANHDR